MRGNGTTDEATIEKLRKENKRYKKALKMMRQALLKTHHGTGDHTDLCRSKNNGMAPVYRDDCQCHVATVARTLEETASLLET